MISTANRTFFSKKRLTSHAVWIYNSFEYPNADERLIHIMKKTLFRMISLTLAVMIASALVSCGEKYDFPESTEEETATVLMIGDYEVPFEQYRYFFMNYKLSYDEGSDKYWQTHDEAEAFAEIDALTRESLLHCYATFALALDHDIDYRSGSVQKAVSDSINKSIENDFGGPDEYLTALSGAYMNNAVYRFAIAEFECEERLFNKFVEAGTITDDDEAIMSAIMGGEFCHAKQILILNNDGDDPEENRKLAEMILSRAKAESDFDALVAEYGEDPEMITNPTGYYFTYGELIEEFEEAAFALKIGELSGVVESHLGYHIILRLEPDPSYVIANFDSLSEAYQTSLFQAEVSKKAETLKITETALFSSLSMDNFRYGKN